MARTFDHDYPPARWTADEIQSLLEDTPTRAPLPRYDDTETWNAIATDERLSRAVEDISTRAAAAADEPIPTLSASLYLDYTRTGNRTRYQRPNGQRVNRLSALALAECIEREGTYLDDVLDYAWAICEQSTWVLPAHLDQGGRHGHDGLPDADRPADRTVALRVAQTGQLLAELDYVLGDQLHPALRSRIRREVDRQLFTPYEEHDDFWWHHPPTNNWNAVCNAGTVIAAMLLVEDSDRIARIVERAAHSLEHYLADFDEDGCTAEGIGYWNYGFGNYVQVAAHLEARTGGEFSLLSPPIVEQIATYPLAVELSPGRFLPFSDASESSRVDPFTACWLGDRLDRPELAARGLTDFQNGVIPDLFGEAVKTLVTVRTAPTDATVPTPPKRRHFTGFDWWIARVDPDDPDTIVVGAKGGHNAESHNHNDLGSFVYHVNGESLLTDLGSPVYDADFFSDRRYEYLVARSLGHSVPYINGFEQAAGEEQAAAVIERTDGDDVERFAVDIAGGYPADAGLDSLVRTFELDRTSNRLTVNDAFAFTDDCNQFEEVLVSYVPIATTDDGFVLEGASGEATVSITPAPTHADVERLEAAVRDRDVWRARIGYDAGESATITTTVDAGP